MQKNINTTIAKNSNLNSKLGKKSEYEINPLIAKSKFVYVVLSFSCNLISIIVNKFYFPHTNQ